MIALRDWQAVFAAAGMLALAACSVHKPLKNVEARAPIPVSADLQVALIQVQPVDLTMLFNEKWGDRAQGPGCLVHPGNELLWRPERESGISRAFTAVLLRELKKANYSASLDTSGAPATSGNSGASGSAYTKDNAPIRIKSTVKKITLNVCYPDIVGGVSFMPLSYSTESNGAAYVQIEWKVHAPSERNADLELSSEGAFQIEQKRKGNEGLLLSGAFAVAARNLLANPRFHGLMTGKR